MPLGPYETFGECVGAQKRKGHSDESARKICGSLEQQASSLYRKDSASYNNNMSAQDMQKEQKKPDDGGGEKVTLSMQQAEALANAAFNDDIETVKKILTDVLDITQEQDAPPGPPMK
jgi:hypothetical protein